MLTLAAAGVEAGGAWTVNGQEQQPAARRNGPGAAAILAVGVGALAVGGIAGWMAATSPGTPSYNYAGAVAGFWAMLILLVIVAIAVIGLLALFFRRWWLTAAFVMGAGCLLGLFGGAWLTDAAGPGYQPPPFPSPPVVLHARGEAAAQLDGVTGFTTHRGSADCTSGPDSEVVATVDVWDAGELQGAMYRGDLHMHMEAAGVDPGTVGVSVYFWSSSMTGSPPQWHGQGRLVTDEPSAGRVTFAHMALDGGGRPPEGTCPPSSLARSPGRAAPGPACRRRPARRTEACRYSQRLRLRPPATISAADGCGERGYARWTQRAVSRCWDIRTSGRIYGC